MNAAAVALFAVGAGIGAPLRYVIDATVQTRFERALPLGTLTVNAIGSLILGAVTALGHEHVIGATARLTLGTAFCGALTTYSTFAFETVRLLEVGDHTDALLTIALNTAVTIALAGAAYAGTLALV